MNNHKIMKKKKVEKLKVLYICRVFSGLAKSMKEKRWQPTGVPTIYKMIEKIDKLSVSSKFIFTDCFK